MVWEFIYFAYQWALSGKTIGMAVLGIRVVTTDGSPIGARQAVIRTLTLPLSFLLLGLGFLGILTNRDRHALHDRLAGTAVVYSWDARAARLRWLAKQDARVRPEAPGLELTGRPIGDRLTPSSPEAPPWWPRVPSTSRAGSTPTANARWSTSCRAWAEAAGGLRVAPHAHGRHHVGPDHLSRVALVSLPLLADRRRR